MGGKSSKVDENENSDSGEKTKTGEPFKYDPKFKGPIKNRSCTDVICCFLFIIFFLGFLGVGVFAYLRGDPKKLIYPTDSDGNLCGYDTFSTRPNVFFFDLIKCAQAGPAILFTGCPTPQICVANCPNTSWVWVQQAALEALPGASRAGRSNMICKNGVDALTSNKTIKQLVEDEDCAPYYVPSTSLVGRCIPSVFAQLADKAATLVTSDNSAVVDRFNNSVTGTSLEGATQALTVLLNAKEYGIRILQDVTASWWMILVGLAIGMVLSFIWIVLMRWVAGVITWLSILLFIGLFGFGTYWCTAMYLSLKDNPAAQGPIIFTTNISYYTSLSITWLILACIAGALLLIILLILLFLRTRILIAISIIKEGSRAISNMIFVLFWPLVPFILVVIVIAYWIASMIYLASSGTSEFGSANVTFNVTNVTQADGSVQTVIRENIQEVLNLVPCDASTNNTAGQICSFIKNGGTEFTIYLQVYQIFMFFWVSNFIIALGQMTLAGAFASYYWAWDKKKDIPLFPISASIWRCFRYHLGTLAFGSLLIAIIQIIRVALEYLDQKLKGRENPVAKFFLKCMKCFFYCLEKFMRFLNKNAYILTAVYGKNFCTSAKNAFFLILRNIVRVAVIDRVAAFLLFISKILITGAVGTLAFFFFDGRLTFLYAYVAAPVLNFYLVPVILIIIGTFIITIVFFSVYGMAVDTLFLCFLEDLERHDGSPEKPYYMNKELMGILGKKNKKPKKEKK